MLNAHSIISLEVQNTTKFTNMSSSEIRQQLKRTHPDKVGDNSQMELVTKLTAQLTAKRRKTQEKIRVTRFPSIHSLVTQHARCYIALHRNDNELKHTCKQTQLALSTINSKIATAGRLFETQKTYGLPWFHAASVRSNFVTLNPRYKRNRPPVTTLQVFRRGKAVLSGFFEQRCQRGDPIRVGTTVQLVNSKKELRENLRKDSREN